MDYSKSSEYAMAGIYQILNRINGKVYIGQSTDIKRRKVEHLCALHGNYHRNQHMQNAFNNYGESNFEFSILEKVPVEFLTEREQYWLDVKKAYDKSFGYNKGSCADAPMRDKHHTKEVKIKIGLSGLGRIPWNKGEKSMSEEHKSKLRKINKENKYNVGRKASDATRLKMSLSRKGRVTWNKGKSGYLSDDSRRKISETLMGNTHTLGYKHTIETKKKISLASIGRTHKVSDETRKKMSLVRKGRIPWNKGKHHSDETKFKISMTKRGISGNL